VLRLIRADKSRRRPVREGEAEVVLRDDEDLPSGHAWTTEGRHWIEIIGVGSFELAPDSREVTAFGEPGIDPSALEETFYKTVLPIALHALGGYQSLHASAILLDAVGVVAFAAVSGTGKSTIAAGLNARGHSVWADDAVAFDVRHETPYVACVGLPFQLRVRQGSSGASTFLEVSSPKDEASDQSRPPFVALCLLERRADAGGEVAEISQLSPTDALTAVIRHAYFFGLRDLERRRQTMDDYLDLVARVPVLRIRFEANLARLPELLDAIERAVSDAVS